MSTDQAELSSIQGTLDDLARRVEKIAERRDADPDDPVGPQLFEVERSLRNAIRQLDRARAKF